MDRIEFLISLCDDKEYARLCVNEVFTALEEGDSDFVLYMFEKFPTLIPKVGGRLKAAIESEVRRVIEEDDDSNKEVEESFDYEIENESEGESEYSDKGDNLDGEELDEELDEIADDESKETEEINEESNSQNESEPSNDIQDFSHLSSLGDSERPPGANNTPEPETMKSDTEEDDRTAIKKARTAKLGE